MSIAEQFGRRRRQEPQPPAIPPKQSTDIVQQHDDQEAASALAFIAKLNDEARRLQSENARLAQELALARARIADLSKQVSDQSFYLEAYRRYSVAVQTNLQTVVDAATRANEAALDVSEPSRMTAEQAKQTIDNVERELRDKATDGL